MDTVDINIANNNKNLSIEDLIEHLNKIKEEYGNIKVKGGYDNGIGDKINLIYSKNKLIIYIDIY